MTTTMNSPPARDQDDIKLPLLPLIRPEFTTVEQQLGWRAYVTNAPGEQLSLPQAVLTYRDEWIAERSFHRLKGW